MCTGSDLVLWHKKLLPPYEQEQRQSPRSDSSWGLWSPFKVEKKKKTDWLISSTYKNIIITGMLPEIIIGMPI